MPSALPWGGWTSWNRSCRDRPFDALISHNRYTLLNRSANAMFDAAHARGIAILNAAPYAGGVLAKGSAVMPRVTYQEADDAMLAPARQVEAACARHGIAPGARRPRVFPEGPTDHRNRCRRVPSRTG